MVSRTLYALAGLSQLTLATLAHAQSGQASTPAPLATAPTAAANPPTASVGEVVVTAQRRDQNLRDVPIAVTAISGVQLQQRQITSSMDVARITPGVYASAASGGQVAAYSIRGVVQNDVSDTAEGPVAIYVDDVYSPNVQAQSFGLYDVDRVEILKGPQGTLFGRNSTGGLVNFVIAKPTDVATGYLDATYGSYNEAKVEGAVGGPLANGIEARASGFYFRNDGYLKDLYPGSSNLGGQTTYSGRLQLQAAPTTALKIRLTGSIFHQDFSTAPYNQIATRNVTDAQGNVVGGITTNAGDFFGYVAPPASKLETDTEYSCSRCAGVRIYAGSLHVDYDLGLAHLSSISSYEQVQNLLLVDAAVSPLNFVDIGYSGTTRSVSQELRLNGATDKFIWNLGAYYLNILSNTANGFIAPRNSVFAGLFNLSESGVDLLDIQRLRSQSSSIFGQAEYKLTQKLSFIAGVRGIHESQDYSFSSSAYTDPNDYAINTTTPLFTLQPSFSGKQSPNLWAAKASLQYKPNRNILTYVTISRGVKDGNFNEQLPTGAPGLTAAQFYYKPEALLDYEGGAKATALNGLLSFDVAAYYYDYSNYQALVFSDLSGIIENRHATIYGGEAQATLRPMHGLEISGSAALVHARVEDVDIAPGIEETVQPPFAPALQVTGRIAYTPDVYIYGGRVTIAGDVYSTSHYFQNIRDFESQRLAGYTIANAQLIWRSPTGFSLTGAVENLTDKRYAVTGYDGSGLCGCSEIAYGKPQWFSLTAGYRF